jgi:phospholipid transport system substrate-binding protein
MASWQEAAIEVDKTIEQMLSKLSPYRGHVDADLEPLYQELELITNDKVDYPYIAKKVMGKYFRTATDQQKIDFAIVFKRTLLKTYGKTLVSFNIDNYELVKPRRESPKPDKQKVVVKVISSDGKSYSMVNYMLKKAGKWQLVNVVLDGFNLRVTFKNQFAKVAQKSKGDLGLAIQEWADLMGKK